MTHEFKEILEGYRLTNEEGLRTVMATVVDVEGSSYRRPGVGMLIVENGKMVGAVSGGCVEKEVLREAQSVFETGKPKVMTYNGRYRLGCEGVLYILIERFSIHYEEINTIQNYLKSRKPFQIKSYYSKNNELTPLQMGSVISFEEKQDIPFSEDIAHLDTIQKESLDCFFREIPPCFKLVIIGAEHDAVSLCKLASITGWEVTIVSSPRDPKQLEDFPGAEEIINVLPEDLIINKVDLHTAIVLMTHNFAKDLLYLQAIKDSQPVYIGLLGPAKRREKVLTAFIDYFPDVTIEFIETIHGPAGLNLGAETPQEIAISIMAEILSVIRNEKPIPLQEKSGGIHGNSKNLSIDAFYGRT